MNVINLYFEEIVKDLCLLDLVRSDHGLDGCSKVDILPYFYIEADRNVFTFCYYCNGDFLRRSLPLNQLKTSVARIINRYGGL